jgi:phosphatidylglycerol---prolipoprotein diacylglyceryl transferase
MNHLIGWLYWNPGREIFQIPVINHPVTWYGVFFALGFALCYFLLTSILTKQFLLSGTIKSSKIKDFALFQSEFKSVKQLSDYPPTVEGLNRAVSDPRFSRTPEEGIVKLETLLPQSLYKAKDSALFLVDRLLWYIIIGTLVGARLGEVIFYDFPLFWQNPMEILMIWHGGLASHGAAIGILLSLYLFYLRKKSLLPSQSFMGFLDLFVIPLPVAFACIRLGNFVNQEILGTPSNVPWAIIFGNPVDRLPIVARHPVMLYEAAAYLALFAVMYTIWVKNRVRLKTGMISGIFFILAFSARFVLEFFKVSQSAYNLVPGLDMGQVLSIPFIVIGFILIWQAAVSNYKVCPPSNY